MAKNKFEDANWAKTQQQSITNQVALKAAVEKYYFLRLINCLEKRIMN